MATRSTELQRIWREIESLKKQVARLEKRKNGKRRTTARKRTSAQSERARARTILREARVTRAMTPEEQKLAGEWNALPTIEKQRVEETLRQARTDPPLSQLIHDMRG